MTDKELITLLRQSNPKFRKTLKFTGPGFNKWIVESGNKKRRPIFAKKYVYRSRSSLASIVNTYYENLTKESLQYPINITIKGLGHLTIYETRILGRERNLLTETGWKKVIDDYISYNTAHWIVAKKPYLKDRTPYFSFEANINMYRDILREVTIRYPKGKFYQFKNLFNY